MTDVDELLNCPLFGDVSRDDVAPHARDLFTRFYAPGQVVFSQEDTSGDVYFLRFGTLLALHLDQNGRELIFTRLHAKDYFGELSAIDGGGRSLSVYSKTDSCLIVIRRQAFLSMMDALPLVRQRVTIDLVGRIRRLTTHSYQLASQSVDKRLKAYLARCALEDGVFEPNGQLLRLPTHAEIAGSIGASREEVSRSISALKRAKILETGRQRLTILQPSALLHEQ
ncbi:Crp/Fnr family transcriptional regulator [Rhizobium sp. P40RR-XXII]|uniref:Crp/Fnr family transcriptional regulator n=1 Tax=unclassified Rhizobium TaxID=2613769 RepID=UPI00145740C0|nr:MULTISPECIES: Crp/Fnr family transcriptional regulator [unclassified Rhizobium]NLR89164.1 Crp/Fnr family transcriptional regulator [Rhizobium sp. P28RR-XV]NLS21018.1 Crp/Fnr family transcriptional regulator [Rhizobium sp. P40RR-XXII]